MTQIFATENPYAAWWSEGDKAKGDEAVHDFVEKASEHRAECETCLSRQPCSILHGLIDTVEAQIQGIGNIAHARYLDTLEKKYSHRDYWPSL